MQTSASERTIATRRARKWPLSALLLAVLSFPACGGGGGTPGAPAPLPTPNPTPTPVAPLPDGVLRTGTFEGANGYLAEGSVALVRQDGAHRLELQPDFRTSRSGALDVRLCRTTACDASDLDLGPVVAFSGAQSYALPDDGAQYPFAVIWCRAVALPFGYAELR